VSSRRWIVCAPALVLVLASSAPLSAWGFDVHRFIADRAIDLLPSPLRPFYERQRAFVSEHAIDPDLWRLAGFTDEAPRHFLNLDAYGPAPFDALPRDLEAAFARFGRTIVTECGLLPWRGVEFHERLSRTFAQIGPRASGRALGDVAFLSAVLSHYVADAHVPFHAVVDYDGQRTGQRGIHARFETELFRRYADGVSPPAEAAVPVVAPLEAMFDVLLASAERVDDVLEADRRAARGRDGYDDEYFDRFFAAVQPVFQQRLEAAITAVAAFITGAWEAGGRPLLPGGVDAGGGAR
jgi:hypothetical protein